MIERGNAHTDGAEFGHWLIGDFATWAGQNPFAVGIKGLRQSKVVELKWGLHPAGERRPEWAACSEKRTISVLVRGKFLIRFRSPSQRAIVTDVRLNSEGDYAIWGTDMEHIWMAEEDAVIFTVRWQENA